VDGRCVVCGEPERAAEPGVPEEYFPGEWCHLSCLNSPEGVAWRRRRAAGDPGFARYLRLSTMGLDVECPACGRGCAIFPKARGMGAGTWEVCCDRCHRIALLDGYAHPAEYEGLVEAEDEFLLRAEGEWKRRVAALAAAANATLPQPGCDCGGRFSVAAAPRCPRCHAVLLDSYFHYADLA